MTATEFSIIIPARNEAFLLKHTVDAALAAAGRLNGNGSSHSPLPATAVEILVVDNASTDETARVLASFTEAEVVKILSCRRRGAACARNYGASNAAGNVLVFIDADTLAPLDSLIRIRSLCQEHGVRAGMVKLASREGGIRAWCWWTFWNAVRTLPLPRAKAMCAFMFCTREAFQRFGPFDEKVAIGEEWPILAGAYRKCRRRFIYDRTITAYTSNRRMELQRFGYSRTFLKYVWAIIAHRGRVYYSDRFRHRHWPSTIAYPHKTSQTPSPIAFTFLSRLGQVLGGIELHDVTCRSITGVRYYAKRRRWYSTLLVLGGNLYFSFLGAPIKVLFAARWHQRERQLYNAIYAKTLAVDSEGWLLVPAHPGISVAQYLTTSRRSPSAKVHAIHAAASALKRFHQISLEESIDGSSQFLSHGDATARNVIYDEQTNVASWFDFETVHHDGHSALIRHADDLRTLLYSCAAFSPMEDLERVIEAVTDAYDDLSVFEAVADQICRRNVRSLAFQLTQAPLPYAKFNSLETVFLETVHRLRACSQRFEQLQVRRS